MASSILIRHTGKWVATDRQSRSHATPHWGPCYAAIFPVTIVVAPHGLSCTSQTGAKPPWFGKPSIFNTLCLSAAEKGARASALAVGGGIPTPRSHARDVIISNNFARVGGVD